MKTIGPSKQTFTEAEIRLAEEQGVCAAALCLMENGLNPEAWIEELERTNWAIRNAFFQGYVEENDATANSLLDKFEGAA